MLLTRQVAANRVVYYASPLLSAVGVPHGFSTRQGGVSPSPFDTLNFGNVAGSDVRDTADRLAENHARFMAAIGLSGHRRHWTTQVHGPAVADVDAAGFADGCDADALVTRTADRALSVRSADCCPVLLATDDGRAVAAAHAGWRGAVAGVVAAAVAALARAAEVGPDRIVAAIGPCITMAEFEVGPEVLDAFAARFGDATVRRSSGGGKGHVDLSTAVFRSLIAAGVSAARINVTDRCTVRDTDEFFSHRRDCGLTGRMVSLIATRAE